MKVYIDPNAGVCTGVRRAIRLAEENLESSGEIYALGELIHNRREVDRLAELGLKTIEREQLAGLNAIPVKNVLVRTHGIPPQLKDELQRERMNVIDATCPVVKRLQQKVSDKYLAGWQIVIFGKQHHPEVIGLLGYCDNNAVVVQDERDFQKIDRKQKTFLLSQTTMPQQTFLALAEKLKAVVDNLETHDSTCKQINNRYEVVTAFSAKVNVVLFVGGKNSSNSKALCQACKSVTANSHHIESAEDIDRSWYLQNDIVGITGGASTPKWQLEEIKDYLESTAP
jgi:4-hydroxy-3-methylbut-2-enyl diphosphate reductase